MALGRLVQFQPLPVGKKTQQIVVIKPLSGDGRAEIRAEGSLMVSVPSKGDRSHSKHVRWGWWSGRGVVSREDRGFPAANAVLPSAASGTTA